MSAGFVVRVVGGPDSGEMASIAGSVVVGRAGDLVLTDPTVSRRHLRIDGGDALVVTDLGSAGGTRVEGRLIAPNVATRLAPGDVVEIGATRLILLQYRRFHRPAAGPVIALRDSAGVRRVGLTGEVTVGRDPSCTLAVSAADVSRVHVRLRARGDGAEVEDLRSANGTAVNGERIDRPVVVAVGDEITLGDRSVRLAIEDRTATPQLLTVRVRQEDTTRPAEVVRIETTDDASVAAVTAGLCVALGAEAASAWLMYRRHDGLLLHPDDAWAATATSRGDELVIGPGDPTSLEVDPTLRWADRRDARVNQLPRTEWPAGAMSVERPTPPETTSLRGRGVFWQILGGVGAILVGLTLAIVKPDYALFGIMAGAIGVVTVGASIAGDQSRRRHRLGDYRERLAAIDQRLGAEVSRQARQASVVAPEIAELRSWVESGSPRLWERRPTDSDALALRIGRGQLPTRVEIESVRDGDSPYAVEFEAITARHRVLDDVPVTGPRSAAMGLAGPGQVIRSLATRMVAEAVCLHAPHQLRVWVFATSSRWDWVRWLPHGGPAARGAVLCADRESLSGTLNRLNAALDEPGSVTHPTLELVVIDVGRPSVALEATVNRLRGRGLAVVLCENRRDLPNGLDVVVDAGDDLFATVTGSYAGAPLGRVVVDQLDESSAEQLALEVGALGAGEDAVASSGLLDALGLGDVGSVDVAALWARPHEALTVAIGAGDDGAPVTIGFRRDGPHGMVAGTTGSGKSELLQTLLVALTLTHPPSELQLFLIDFKGGATFAPLATLPHVVGLVTDLESDTSMAGRAFTALEAEIARRKRELDAAGVANIVEHERRLQAGAAGSPMANLVVVIDEFALLVERQPDVKPRLDVVATQGRSLGVHLLLATQSPSGVITSAIRANTNLWMALRVVSDGESLELLGAKDAARIPDNSPGRGFVRLGASEQLTGFQAGRIARPLASASPPVVIRSGSGELRYSAPLEDRDGPIAVTELDVAVERIVDAARVLGATPPPPLWLAPLPDHLSAADLAADRDRESAVVAVDGEAPATDGRLTALVGMVDRPDRAFQGPYAIDLTACGHALVCGVRGSGRTTALLQIASDLAARQSPADLHLYGVESGSGSLAPLAGLPHTAGVIGVGDPERLGRLFDRLTSVLEARREVLATAGGPTFTRWRADGGAEPWIVLVLDDLAAFREAAEQLSGGRWLEQLNALLQGGPSVGLHVVTSINQPSDLRLNQTNLIRARLLLRHGDPADRSLLDVVPLSTEDRLEPPGRCFVSDGGLVQIAQPDAAYLGVVAQRWRHVDAGRPRAIIRLPREVRRDDAGGSQGRRLVIGVGGPEVTPVSVDLGLNPPVLAVVGPIRSGRSTALLSACDGILAADTTSRITVIALRPGPLRSLVDDPRIHEVVTTVDRVAAALDELTAGPGSDDVVVIDDAESLVGVTGVAERLDPMLRSSAETGRRFLIAARIGDLPGMYDPWARYLISLRRAVLLQPTVDDGFVFGVKVPSIPAAGSAGRGVLVDGNQVTVLQIMLPALVDGG